MEFAIAMEDNLQRRVPRVKRQAATVPQASTAHGLNTETARLLQTITMALRPFPEARAAVVAALQNAERPPS